MSTSDLKFPKIVGYRLLQRIGGGAFSTVYKAFNESNGSVAACKHLQPNNDQERKTIEKEMRIHANLKHRHVLEFINAVVVDPKQQSNYIPGIYMVLELAAGGDLFDKIAPDVGVDIEVAHHYFTELLEGMGFIHDQGVCHRDLKPENLLLDVSGMLKISDFGLSSVFKLKESGKIRTLTERCGSLPYVAPELNSDQPYQAEPVDVWGIGVILFTLLGGNTPWDEPTSNSPEFRRYAEGSIYKEAPWNRFGDAALSLLTGLLTINPQDRLTIPGAMAHPWCSHPSQLKTDPVRLADKLTQSLRDTGDMDLANPTLDGMDGDGDAMMLSGTLSQFTQSLQLFSQTQGGTRYTPDLTRFYARLPPETLMHLTHQALLAQSVRCKGPQDDGSGLVRLRVAGLDMRKQAFKGWISVESFTFRGEPCSFCVMQRDEGSPLSWRQLWQYLVKSSEIASYVLRK